MIRTFGLTHIALAVTDPHRSAVFYSTVFGMKTVYESDDFVQLQTPGAYDVLVLQRDATRAGREGGVVHFGFRLQDPAQIEAAAEQVEASGGRIRERGESFQGSRTSFFEDPEGYEVEVWFELPTPVDP
jgi:catechol 2,3-dioxygenase-like lactoylglutathione lyase family enzyme